MVYKLFTDLMDKRSIFSRLREFNLAIMTFTNCFYLSQVAVCTLSGQICVFNVRTSDQMCTIDGRNDLGSGRSDTDLITSKKNLRAKYVSISPNICLNILMNYNFIYEIKFSEHLLLFVTQLMANVYWREVNPKIYVFIA